MVIDTYAYKTAAYTAIDGLDCSYFPSLLLPLFLEVGPLKPATGFGERCRLRQWGLDEATVKNEFGVL